MIKRILLLAFLLTISFTSLFAQDNDYDGLDNTIDLCNNTADRLNTDTDGDGIGDVCDLDDDNDGILDSNDCEIAIPNYSFEDGFTNWTIENSLGNPPINNFEISPANDGPFPGAEGINYLDIEAYNETVILTSSNAIAIYEETGYIFEVSLGDLPTPPPPSTVTSNFVDDGDIILELGYGNNSANYTPIPGAILNIHGPTETIEGWNDFTIPFDIDAGNPAIGNGILIRITHTGIGVSALGLAVDFVRLSRDSDSDGISNCKEIDSDNDGCFDVIEAGHTDSNNDGALDGVIAADGSVIAADGYSGNKYEVLRDDLVFCDNFYQDNDQDNVTDSIDLDDDNDGILDIYDCEIPILNFSFENNLPGEFPQDGWLFSSTGGASVAIPNGIDDHYNASDLDQYAFINGTGEITQTQVYASYEPGSYILSLDIGDGIDYYNDPFRNDGRTEIQLGYLNNLGTFIVVESFEVLPEMTANGVWTPFKFRTTLTNSALGEGIVIRINHFENDALNQRRGHYDNISLKRDRDNDGDEDCIDSDSDADGCTDVIEVGHIDDGSGQLLGTGIDPTNGLVIGYSSGYTGLRSAYFDDTIISCNLPMDTDVDGVPDGDSYYFMANGNTAWDEFDLDNDNDGILDTDEGCSLTIGGFAEEASNFEQVPNNQLIIIGDPNSQPFVSGNGFNGNGVVEFFNASNPAGIGSHLVNAAAYINPNNGQAYPQNYFTDGTLQPDIFDATGAQPSAFNNDQFAFINGDGILTQLRSYIILEQGGYIISISVGDGLDYEDPYRNDGTTQIEAGFGSLTNFNVLTDITINPEDTPNGTWTDFLLNLNIPAASPAIGQEILLRITHTGNLAANQLSGNYDNIRISKDTDGDNIPDCLDDDSDDDGCSDATEAGFENEDLNEYVGLGIPTVANGSVNPANGLVTGTNGYNPPVNGGLPIITPAAPVVLAPLGNETSCEGGNVIFSSVATRSVGIIIYEWYQSTDGGATFNLLTEVAPFSGTNTADLNIANVTALQNNNQYRIRVMGDDYLCFEEGTALLTVTPSPTVITPVATSTEICEGDDAEFTFTGDADDIITYTLDAGATTQTITLDATGNAALTITAPTANVTLTIISIEDGVNSCLLTLTPTTSETVTINSIPLAPINPTLNAAVCEGNTNTSITVDLAATGTGDIIIWYDAAIGGVSLGSGLTFTSTETAPNTYTYYAEAESSTSGCVSATRTEVTFTINPAVTADIITVPPSICDSYTLPALTAGNTYYTATGGPSGTGTLLTSGDVITTSQTIYIYTESGTAPNCTDESSFDVTIDITPNLQPISNTCSTDLSTYEVIFQAFTGTLTTTAGTVIGNDTVTDIPAGTDITITATNNSCSATLDITAPNCNCPNLDVPQNEVNGSNCQGTPTAVLSVDIPITGGDTINWYDVASGGTLIATGETFTPLDTASGTYTYYAETFDSVTSCESVRIPVTLTIINTPIADSFINPTPTCDTYTLPALSPGNNFYTGTNGTGTMLNEGDSITTSQTIYIYTESGTTPNCFDESSFDVAINTTPTLIVDSKTCATNLLTYEVVLEPYTGILTSSAGTIVGNDRIIDIPAGTDITITASNNSCTNTLDIEAPDCSCPQLDAPENPTNGGNCVGEPTSALSVDLPSTGGDSINWFNTPSGGTAIGVGESFTPLETAIGQYTFYAETTDTASLCSSTRTAVTLTITEIPTIDNVQNVESCEFYSLPALPEFQKYFTAPNGSGNELNIGQQILTSQTIYIFVQAANNTSCSSEASFDVTVLNEPILNLPTNLSLCSEITGTIETIYLGEDLGPNYIYDWTPNNDTNNDGVEEAIFEITTAGTYTLQIYEVGNTMNCGGFTSYSTIITEAPQPSSLEVEVTAKSYMLDSGNRVRLIAGENPLEFDQFEYSITSAEGPYQADNIFENVDGGLYTGYVRSKSGCDFTISSAPFLIVNYPTFFSPNGDGANETWKPLGIDNLNITSQIDIYIYDRQGKLLSKLDPLGPGWDGTYNNSLMTPSDYWFKVNFIDELNNEPIQFSGHFSLIR